MKKLLILALMLVMLISLCACSNNSNTNSPETTTEPTSDTSKDNGKPEDAFTGVWTHEKTDDEPYFIMITLLEDGTGSMGKTGKTKLTWEQTGETTITITIPFENAPSTVKEAHLLDDGTLKWDYTFTFKDYGEVEMPILTRK